MILMLFHFLTLPYIPVMYRDGGLKKEVKKESKKRALGSLVSTKKESRKTEETK